MIINTGTISIDSSRYFSADGMDDVSKRHFDVSFEFILIELSNAARVNGRPVAHRCRGNIIIWYYLIPRNFFYEMAGVVDP